MDKRDYIILYLSVSLMAFQTLYTREAIKRAYLQGQADLYATWTTAGQDMDDAPYVSMPVRAKSVSKHG